MKDEMETTEKCDEEKKRKEKVVKEMELTGKEVVGTLELEKKKKTSQVLGEEMDRPKKAQTSIELLLAATSEDVGDVSVPMGSDMMDVKELEVVNSVATEVTPEVMKENVVSRSEDDVELESREETAAELLSSKMSQLKGEIRVLKEIEVNEKQVVEE